MAVVMVSGGFDPLHFGHVRLIEGAARYGRVIVALNSDDWLRRKKGYVFMPWAQRAEIIGALRWVHESDVTYVDDADGSVCEALRRVRPDYFANGGDRLADNIPEVAVCRELGIEMLFGVGGDKIESSSKLVAEARSREAHA